MKEHRPLLPLEEHKDELLRTMKYFQVVIVVGDTGCGKTTKIPSILLDAGYADRGKIVCTEPRRIAAIAAARRVASERNEIVGQTIGYHVRFEEAQCDDTKYLFATDGVLMNETRSDPHLRRYRVIVVDEAHERRLYTDYLLAYVKSLCALRSDLKVVIASATINPVQFMGYFQTLGVVKVPGRLYPVMMEYREHGNEVLSALSREVRDIHLCRKEGDILAFLPGISEILKAQEAIEAMRLNGLVIVPIFGGMEPKEQERVFDPVNGRKVILATNIAETSLTIPGVRYVVDSGFVRVPGFDPRRNVETLTLERISRSSATQRAGRVGRVSDGVCIRLLPESEYRDLSEETPPEIVRNDITGLVLTARKAGIANVHALDLLTRPPKLLADRATATLARWGALDAQGKLTALGKRLSALSVEPALARFIAIAAEEGCLKEAATIAAFLTARNLFFREGGSHGYVALPREFEDPMGDLFSFLRVWFSYQAPLTHPNTWCRQWRINPQVMHGICHIRAQLIREALRARFPNTASCDRDVIGRAIIKAFGHHLCRWESRGRYRCGTHASIALPKSSVLFARMPEEFVAVSFLDTGSGKIWALGNVEVQPEWRDCLPPEEPYAPRVRGNLRVSVHGIIRLREHGEARTIVVNLQVPQDGIEEPVIAVAGGCLALDTRKIPFLKPHALTMLRERPKTRPLTSIERTAPFPAVLEADEEVQEKVIREEKIDDRLLQRFLDRPVQMLGISSGIVMRLLSGKIATIRDFAECRENDFITVRGRGRQQGFRFEGLSPFDEGEIAEMKHRLAVYGLAFKPAWHRTNKSMMPSAEIKMREVRVSETAAQEILGAEDFRNLTLIHTDASIAARNALCVKHRGLAWSMAVKYDWAIPEHEKDPADEAADYASEGMYGLLRAIVAFDPLGGFRFSTYATQWIAQAITRYIANGGIVRIPMHVWEANRRTLSHIAAFTQKHGRSPDANELGEIMGRDPAEARAVLDQILLFRNIARLEDSIGRGDPQDEELKQFKDLLVDTRGTPESALTDEEFRQAMRNMFAQSRLIEIDRKLLTLHFGLGDEDPHSVEELADLFQLDAERIAFRISAALDALRTRGNWEQMREYRSLPDFPQTERMARWKKAIEALVHVLAEAEESWPSERYLERLAGLLSLPLSAITTHSGDPDMQEARAVSAALLWSPCGLKISDIATRLRFENASRAAKDIHRVARELERRKLVPLAQAFRPSIPDATVAQDLAEDDATWYDGLLPPVSPEEVAHVRALLDQVELTPRMRLILETRIGLDRPSMTLDEVGELVGKLTRERVRQIQVTVEERLRESKVWPELKGALEPIFEMVKNKAAPETTETVPAAPDVPRPSRLAAFRPMVFGETVVKTSQDPTWMRSFFRTPPLPAPRAPQGHTHAPAPVPQEKPAPQKSFAPSTPKQEGTLAVAAPTTDTHPRSVKPETVLALVGARYTVSVEELRSAMREVPVAMARQVAMYVLRQCGFSFSQIAEIVNRKDHTTVIHGCKKIGFLAQTDARFAEEMQKLINDAQNVSNEKGDT